jgi:hypothetical protein
MDRFHRRRTLCSTFILAALAALIATVPANARTAATGRATTGYSVTARGHAVSSLPLSTAPARSAANANPATYTDTTGDGGSAPDITSVVVSNDANNRITFRINVANLVVPSTSTIGIAIDSDQNATTGSQGIDYIFLGDPSHNSFGVARWNGSGFVDAQPASATASTDETGLTFSINSTDLGNTTAFNFWARTLKGDSVAAGNHDDAPDVGTWNYQLGPAGSLKLTAQLFHLSKARAGKPFVAVFTVDRSDGAVADITLDDVSCAATIAGRPLQNGLAVALGPAVGCSWLLPKHSKGKRLRASITVNLDGATVTKRLTTRVR